MRRRGDHAPRARAAAARRRRWWGPVALILAAPSLAACDGSREQGPDGADDTTSASSSGATSGGGPIAGAGGGGGAVSPASTTGASGGGGAGGGDVTIGVGAGGSAPAPACDGVSDHDGAVLLAIDTLRTAGGVTWSWSDHHYVERDGVVVASEVWFPWMACGADQCLVGTSDPMRTYAVPIGDVPIDPTPMVPWAGDLELAVLLEGVRDVHQVRPGEPPVLVAQLPVDARLPRPDDEQPPGSLAGLAGSDVVWAAADGSVRRTSLTEGTTTTLAVDAEPDVLVAAGAHAAWRRGETVTWVDLADGVLTERAVDPGRGLALHDGACVLGVGAEVQILPLDGGPARSLPIGGGQVDAIAADACGVAIGTSDLRVLFRTAP